MGFFDKIKDAGKGALKGALIMAAKSYATSTDGKHKLCKVSMNSAYDKITFVKGASIEAEYVIKDSIKTFYVSSEDDLKNYHVIELVFNDGEKTKLLLSVDTKQGSALPSAEDRLAAHYDVPSYLVEALAKHVPEIDNETKKWVNKIMRYAKKDEVF